MKKIILSICVLLITGFNVNSQELVIAEERVEPGIVFVFEGAIKDHIVPMSMHLQENQTNVHIEARVNWDINNVPKGAPKGGFVPYLHITARITIVQIWHPSFVFSNLDNLAIIKFILCSASVMSLSSSSSLRF